MHLPSVPSNNIHKENPYHSERNLFLNRTQQKARAQTPPKDVLNSINTDEQLCSGIGRIR